MWGLISSPLINEVLGFLLFIDRDPSRQNILSIQISLGKSHSTAKVQEKTYILLRNTNRISQV